MEGRSLKMEMRRQHETPQEANERVGRTAFHRVPISIGRGEYGDGVESVPTARSRRLLGPPALLVLLLAVVSLVCPAQVSFTGKLKNFKFPDYYPPTSPAQTNQALKTLLSGAEAQQLPGGQVRINGLLIESFREDGQRELEVHATDCVFDIAAREAWGPGHLQVTSATGLYAVEGDGFFWRQSDGFLVISNRATSMLQRGLLATRSPELNVATNPPLAAAGSSTGQVVRITSERCVFNNLSNQVMQSGHVLADDAQLQIGCELLKVQFTPEKRLQEIVAEQNVSILNKADQSRATAGRGTYVTSTNQERLTLTEHPAWHDRENRQEAKADRFTFDLNDKIIRGEGGARLRLPRGSFSQPSLLPERTTAVTNRPPAAAGTNEIEITSKLLTLLLATTNHPYRSAVVEQDVVILSPADDTRATGDKAVYREDTGLIELTGHAQWAAEGRVVGAEVLTMDRTNRVFRGQGRSSFRLPLQQVGAAGYFRGPTNQAAATNLFLEVFSEELRYETNTLRFQGGVVRTRVLEGEALRGLITCGQLTAHFTDRLDSLLAEKYVVAENYPPTDARGRTVTNLLSCEVLAASFSESGQAIAIVASENVQAAQIETREAGAKTSVTELICDLLTAVVLPKIGRVDKLQAERHVVISQWDRLARGEQALYTDRENKLVLSGHPYAQFAEGKVTDADILVWDRATGAFKGQGKYHIEWTRPAGGGRPNQFLFLRK
jgi:lipopolysaccharide export system protein LptA